MMATPPSTALSLRRSIPRFIFWDGLLAALLLLGLGLLFELPPVWVANPVGLFFGFVSIVLCRAFLLTLLALGVERVGHRLRPHLQRTVMYLVAYFLPQLVALFIMTYLMAGGSGTVARVEWQYLLNLSYIINVIPLWVALHAPQVLAAVLTELTEPLPRLRANGTLALGR